MPSWITFGTTTIDVKPVSGDTLSKTHSIYSTWTPASGTTPGSQKVAEFTTSCVVTSYVAPTSIALEYGVWLAMLEYDFAGKWT